MTLVLRVALGTCLLCSLVEDASGQSSKEESEIVVGDPDEISPPRLATDPRSKVHPAGTILSDWSPHRRRWFASARADLGFLFIRPRGSAGYGVPHHYWWGLDVVPIFSQNEGGGYAGLRFRHPRFEIRSGILGIQAFERGFLEPGDSFTELDLEREGDPAAAYWASDTELTLSAPVGPAYLFSETQAIRTLGLDPNRWVWVQTMGVIVAPDWAFRQQLRLTFPMPGFPSLFVGPAVEGVLVPERGDDPWTLRVGGAAQLWLYQDLQLTTEFLPTVYSPDGLGRMGSSWLRINARFLWATD